MEAEGEAGERSRAFAKRPRSWRAVGVGGRYFFSRPGGARPEEPRTCIVAVFPLVAGGGP